MDWCIQSIPDANLMYKIVPVRRVQKNRHILWGWWTNDYWSPFQSRFNERIIQHRIIFPCIIICCTRDFELVMQEEEDDSNHQETFDESLQSQGRPHCQEHLAKGLLSLVFGISKDVMPCYDERLIEVIKRIFIIHFLATTTQCKCKTVLKRMLGLNQSQIMLDRRG